jgi:cellulose synthase/poly-beta-1,6-N-acetylglucosamine synthase-like glycosyltransferase
MPPVSVIITAAHEEKSIGQAVSSFLPQLAKDDQLIVIAPDQSTLNAAQKVSSRVKIIQDRGKGKPSALNQAVNQATGQILVLSDGDVYVSAQALKHLLSSFKNPKVGIVSGHPLPTNSRNSLYGFWAYLAPQTAHLQRQKRAKKNLPVDCSGYLLALRSSLFTPLPPDALADDALITQNILNQGFQTAYAPRAEVFVKYPTNFRDWIHQKVRSVGGASLVQFYSPGVGKALSRGVKPSEKHVKQKIKMRGFTQELGQVFTTLSLVATPREFLYWFLAFLFRFYLWILIFIRLKILKTPSNRIWTRIESTK